MKKIIEEREKSPLFQRDGKNRVLRILVVPALFICGCFFCVRAFGTFVGAQNARDTQVYIKSTENIPLAQENELSTDEIIRQDTSEKFSADDWRLILVNKQNSIPADYKVTLGTIQGEKQCDERIVDELQAMLKAAKDDDVGLFICSPYRDMERQEYLFYRKITRYMDRGFSYLEAYRLAAEYVTPPGASEHQLGLAFDLLSNSYTKLNAGFADTEAGKWLAEHCDEYGFILRYPLGKEYITGIEYEPWHFRYVGVEAAKIIMEQGITLEEFWEEYVE